VSGIGGTETGALPRDEAPIGADTAVAGERMVWRLDLAYEGTAYRGWACQPGERTVQGTIEEALAMVLREPVRLSVAGRTDAGVHAWAQVASFTCTRADLRPERLRRSLNAVLPPDISVMRAEPASAGFVAREAVARTYEYRLWVSPAKPVRDRAYVWPVRGRPDVGLLAQAAALLPGRHDFAALTPSARLYHSCVREVYSAVWAPAEGGQPGPAASPGHSGAAGHVRPGAAAYRGAGATSRLPTDPASHWDGACPSEWVFTIRAGSFLHNMVRVAVGSMVDVAQGRMSVDEFAAALASGERRRAGQTAPARGLALVAVEY
jgi:tRNA pseudouridine38-40 synthase